MPAKEMTYFVQDGKPYFIQVDISFEAHGRYSWDDLAEYFAIWFNVDRTLGVADGHGFGDKIKIFAEEDKFGFQYEVLAGGVPTIYKFDNYRLSNTEIARREFKIRVDVEDDSKAYLLVNGNDVGDITYNYPMKSSAIVQWVHKVPRIITARICKIQYEPTLRKKRSLSISLHKWGTDTITYNHQNFSSTLGEEKTRIAIKGALEVLAKSAKLTFIEKPKTEVAMLSYMFIKGKHADGLTFYGAGLEKAHAFSPVHSEIHFNDFENFSLKKKEGATSIFYVALHETGHALGLRHSVYKDAVMYSAYRDSAFDVKTLHRDDQRALQAHYPGMGAGCFRHLYFICLNVHAANDTKNICFDYE